MVASCGSSFVTDSEAPNDPTCLGNPNATAFDFDTAVNVLHPIPVCPRNTGLQGQFAIQVTECINPANDNCAQCQPLEIGDDAAVGSTANATFTTRSSDVHRGFVGAGRRVRASTCFDVTTAAHNFTIRNGGCGSSFVTGS